MASINKARRQRTVVVQDRFAVILGGIGHGLWRLDAWAGSGVLIGGPRLGRRWRIRLKFLLCSKWQQTEWARPTRDARGRAEKVTLGN